MRLEDTERRWNKAIEDNRVDEMAAFMHDDWIIFSGDGNFTTKADFLNFVRSGDLVHTCMDFKFLRAKIYGDTGLVVQRGTSAGTWQGQPFSNCEIASTTFIREGDLWLAVQTMIAPAEGEKSNEQ